MKLFAASILVLFAIGYVQAVTQSYDFNCVTGDGTTEACTAVEAEGDTEALALTAAQALAFCNSPDNSVTDNAYTTYGCGECDSAAEGTCVSCAAYADDADNHDCNTYAAPTVTITWSCSGSEDSCSGTEISCFGASDTYDVEAEDADATLIAGGCGGCDDYAADDCQTCATELCNNAVRVASIMGPLLALFFWLH